MFNKSLRIGSVALFALIALIGIGLVGSSGPTIKTVSGYAKGQPDPVFSIVSVTIHYQGLLKQAQGWLPGVPYDFTCTVNGNMSDSNTAKINIQFNDANGNNGWDANEQILARSVSNLSYTPRFKQTGFGCQDNEE